MGVFIIFQIFKDIHNEDEPCMILGGIFTLINCFLREAPVTSVGAENVMFVRSSVRPCVQCLFWGSKSGGERSPDFGRISPKMAQQRTFTL